MSIWVFCFWFFVFGLYLCGYLVSQYIHIVYSGCVKFLQFLFSVFEFEEVGIPFNDQEQVILNFRHLGKVHLFL